jgi:hypothetical protein
LGLTLATTVLAQEPIDTTELEHAKTRLLDTLTRSVTEQENEKAAFQALVQQQGGMPTDQRGNPRFTIPIETVTAAAERRLASTQHLLQQLQPLPAPAIPAFLSNLFLSCHEGQCTDGITNDAVDDSIAAFGLSALQPVLAQLPKLNAGRKETALYLLLRVEPRHCPAPTLQAARGDTVFRVRAAALRITRKNCTETEFVAALNQLLADEQNPEFLLALLDEVPTDSAQAAPFRNRLLDLAEKKRIPLDKAFAAICDASKSNLPLETVKRDIAFWHKAYSEFPLRQTCLIEQIFLKQTDDTQREQLRPLFHDAAEQSYGFSATQGLYGRTAPADAAQRWNATPALADAWLQHLRQHLSRATLKTWLATPETTLGEKLLLQSWLGMTPVSPPQWRLSLTVTAADNSLVATSTQIIRTGQPFSFTVAPRAEGFQTIAYSGTLAFNAEKLHLTIPDFLVGLQPSGAGFAVNLPLTGRFSTPLSVSGQSYNWTLQATPQP